MNRTPRSVVFRLWSVGYANLQNLKSDIGCTNRDQTQILNCATKSFIYKISK